MNFKGSALHRGQVVGDQYDPFGFSSFFVSFFSSFFSRHTFAVSILKSADSTAESVR